MAALLQNLPRLGQFTSRHALEIAAARLEMDTEPDAEEVEERRNRRRLDDVEVRHADELRHEERRRSHDRRHELSARRSSRFDRAREVALIAELLHHGNREGARARDVGDRAARYRAHEAARKHGDLRRAAARPARHGIRKVDEELAESRRFQVGTEKDEEENEG